MKYRKKPVVIEATQWFKNGDHTKDYKDIYEVHGTMAMSSERQRELGFEGLVVRRYRTPSEDGQTACKHCGNILHTHGWIDTLEGGHIVCPGDWVITGVKGEMYPCKPDIFEATYEPA